MFVKLDQVFSRLRAEALGVPMEEEDEDDEDDGDWDIIRLGVVYKWRHMKYWTIIGLQLAIQSYAY